MLVFETILQWSKSPIPTPFVHHHFSHTQCSWLCPPLSLVQWSRKIQRKTCTDEWLLQFPRASHHTRSWEGRPPPGKDFISKSQQGWFDWQMIDSTWPNCTVLPNYILFNLKTQIFCFYLIVKRKKKKTRRQARKDFIRYTTTVMSQAPEPPKQKHKQTNKQINKQTNKQTVTMSQHHKPCLWFVSTWVQGRCKIWYDMASKTHELPTLLGDIMGHYITYKTLFENFLWECVTTFRTESLGFEALPGEESRWQMGSLQRDRGPGLQHTHMHIRSYLPEVKI